MRVRYQFDDVTPMADVAPVVNVIIEIPKGCRNKFEIDKQTGLMKLDRYLYSSSHYPGDYGFIPQTLAEDGDPMDVLVMVSEPTFSGCLIKTRIIGIFRMTDHGTNDYKLLGVPDTDPLFAEFQDLKDCPKHFLREVEHFFTTYKQLEGVTVQAEGWGMRKEAIENLDESIIRFGRARQQLTTYIEPD